MLVEDVVILLLQMMPPHLTVAIPASGQALSEPTIVLHGYSLRYAEDPELFDETVGEPVPITFSVDVELEGPVDETNPPPGSMQERSILTISIDSLESGHRYLLHCASETLRYVAP